MSQTLDMTLWWHNIGAITMGAMVVIYAILVLSGDGDSRHRWRIRAFLPAYYTMMAIVAFSGFVVWAMSGFMQILSVWAMLAGWLALLFLGIIGFKRVKMSGRFKRFLVIKAGAELAIIGVLMVI